MLKAWELEGFADLSESGKLVYFYLCAKKKASTVLIPKTLGITKAKAEKAIKELVKVGAIAIEKKRAIVTEDAPKKKEPADNGQPEVFEAFWSVYPRKEDRMTAEKAFRHINEAEKNRIIAAARNYATQCEVKKTEPKYIYKPVNFIKKLIYLSYIVEETKYRDDHALDTILEWGECL